MFGKRTMKHGEHNVAECESEFRATQTFLLSFFFLSGLSSLANKMTSSTSSSSSSSVDVLCQHLSRLNANCRRRDTSKVDRGLLSDLSWSAELTGDALPPSTPQPHVARSAAWVHDRKRAKLQQIALARAADQQQQLALVARASADRTRALLHHHHDHHSLRSAHSHALSPAPVASPSDAATPPPFGGVGTGFNSIIRAGASTLMDHPNRPQARAASQSQQQQQPQSQQQSQQQAKQAHARGTLRQSSVMADSADLEHQLALLERESSAAARAAVAIDSASNAALASSAGVAAASATASDDAVDADAPPPNPMLRALHADLKREANERRIRAINRKLEDEKQRMRHRVQRRDSKADQLERLAALEKELLAEAGGVAPALTYGTVESLPALFKQQSRGPTATATAGQAAPRSTPALPPKDVQHPPVQSAAAAATAAAAAATAKPGPVRVSFILLEKEVTIEVEESATVASAKRRAHGELASVLKANQTKPAGDYMLFADDFMANEAQLLADTPYIVLCRAKGVRPRIELLSITLYKLFVQQVQAVTGFDQKHLEDRGSEAAHFRLLMSRELLLQRYRQQQALAAYDDAAERDAVAQASSVAMMPPHLPAELTIKVHVTAVLLKTVRCPARQAVREVLREAIAFATTALGAGTAGAPAPTAKNAPAWVLKVLGRQQFLLDVAEPIGTNEHIQALLRDGVAEIPLLLVDTARCAPSLALEIERDLLEARTTRAVALFDGRLTVDERLRRDADDAAIWRAAPAGGGGGGTGGGGGGGAVTVVDESDRKLRVRMVQCDALDVNGAALKKLYKEKCKVWVSVQLYCSGVAIGAEARTDGVPLGASLPLLSWLDLERYRNLPWATVALIQLQANYKKKDMQVCVGWCTFRIFGFNDRARHGTHTVCLQTDDVPDPCAPTAQFDVAHAAATTPPAPTLTFEVEILSVPMAFARGFEYEPVLLPRRDVHTPAQSVRQKVDVVLERDALCELSASECTLVWTQRSYCRTRSCAAAKLLQSIPWEQRDEVREAYRVLREWEAPLEPVDALLVFGSACVDKVVRAFGVRQLERLGNRELSNYLLQLVAALKHEPHHFSPLAAFLVQRALADRRRLGHRLFWLLRAEAQSDAHRERCGLLLEAFFRGCSRDERDDLIRQHELNERLRDVAAVAQETKRDDRQRVLQRELESLNARLQARSVALPLDAAWRVRKLLVPKCRSLDSKTMPLWLAFENDDALAEPLLVLFKAGDDLRQDQLTLQMMYLMDLMWLNAGLDLRAINYGCVATGPEVGFIQIVLNCSTSADIQLEQGGITAAFSEKPLSKWLRKHNAADDAHARAVENFVRSCAASCVATYVLGVCDRHNDNIMVTKDGRLFHIDFGRFLGNYQMFGAFRRDRAPFVLTPEFVFAMGGKQSPNFERFCDMACRAFNIVRHNAHVLIALFSMMVSTGIPELQSIDDLDYLREALQLDCTDDEAAALFRDLIHESLNTKATTFNFAVHLAARPE